MKQIEIKIIAAATYFAHTSRRVTDIANAFGVDTRTVRRWANNPIWQQTLDVIGYKGDRRFLRAPAREVARDTHGLYTDAKKAYQDAALVGEPKHKLAAIAAEKVGLSARRVRDWAKKYNWKRDTQ